jgi:hypothetical protein
MWVGHDQKQHMPCSSLDLGVEEDDHFSFQF